MDLFIMRHGQAHPQVTDDTSRELTKHGRHETQAMATQVFVKKKFTPAKIISSTYVRAIQTAEEVAHVLHYKKTIQQADQLTLDADPRDAFNFLEKQKADSLLIVSHQPLVGQLISLLVEGVIEERHIPTSAIAYIKISKPPMIGSGHLRWLETP
jgi:phosphohistidine phosphatase